MIVIFSDHTHLLSFCQQHLLFLILSVSNFGDAVTVDVALVVLLAPQPYICKL